MYKKVKKHSIFTDKKKKSGKIMPPFEAATTLYLRIDSPHSSMYSCELMNWNPHDKDYDNFMPIACDVMEYLFAEMITVAFFECYAIQKPKKRLFLHNKPAQYVFNDHSDRILNYIGLHPEEQCGFLEKERCFGAKLPNIKVLYVIKEHITASFIKNAYIDTFVERYKHTGYELVINGYRLTENKPIQAVINNNYDISIYYDATHSMLSIDCDKNEYPIEKLIDILTNLAEKHGKKLEVQR